MLDSVLIRDDHVMKRFNERLNLNIRNKNGVTLSLNKAVRVNDYHHEKTNNQCANYVLTFRGKIIVLAVDEDNKRAISVMTSGRSVDYYIEKAREILTQKLDN